MTDRIPFVDLKAQYLAYKGEIDEAIARVLEHCRFINGPEVEQLEQELARYTGCRHAITCANGTDALQLCLMALGIGPGDEVIVPAFTFIATAEVVPLLGATPVFVDIREDIFTMDPTRFEEAITPRTRAVIPVSLFGQPADMDEINDIAARHEITVIEDAAQSFGATYKGRKSCNLSTMATTSFFPAKPLGCYGDGGAVFTSDDNLAAALRMLRNHGQSRRYVHDIIGVNSRLDTIQAAVLLVKLQHLDDEIRRRMHNAGRYVACLGQARLRLPVVASGRSCVWAQFCVTTPDRDTLLEHLRGADAAVPVHYPAALPKQPAFQTQSPEPRRCPVADRVAQRIMSLPVCAYTRAESIERLARLLTSAQTR